MGQDKHAIVQFFGTHPSYAMESQKLIPEWDKLAEMYVDNPSGRKDVNIGKIDGWTFPAISQKYGLKSFPAILFFVKGSSEPKERYLGTGADRTAQKLNEWVEGLIAATEKEEKEKEAQEKATQEGAATENKTATATKTTETDNKAATPEPVSDEGQNAGDDIVVNVAVDEAEPEPEPEPEPESEPEPVKTQPKKEAPKPQQTQQQVKTPPKAEPAPPKEVKVVLDTNLLKGQFTTLQGQIDTANQKLHGNIADNFKKVDELKELIKSHSQEITNLNNNLKSHSTRFDEIKNGLNTNKQEVHKSITQDTDKQFEELKNSLNQIRTKVYERREEPSGMNFGQGALFFVLGSIVGAGVAYVLLGQKKNKSRSFLD